MANDQNLKQGKWSRAGRSIELPAECPDEVPPIPSNRATRWGDSERERWESIWKGPAAVLYDDAQTGAVALLIDLEAAQAQGKLQAAQLTEYRRLLSDLLLTPQALSGAGFRLPGWPT
ncbi:hypothetical protein [Streptomyces sp. CdTB01]|uniref:hypothetical protein n=1 Tax=Streptomyces sp. CdTB01 TaxID=1725411 RepID=UPI00073AC9D5|nr:hypothetical protein [Streptomyces sp. CdTB01]ALV35741.1 hypothetical protein AS200_29640 [Streptomyces sp. CdTB01]